MSGAKSAVDKKGMRRLIRAVVCQVALLVLTGASVSGVARAEKLVNPADVAAWADQYYGRAVAEKRTVGLTVAVVQDGEVIFTKGYGYADYAKRIPVDPEQSGFIVGSITKTFIATAIGQLIDRGVIGSFDDPANKYLKRVQLPGARGSRVTLRYLLSHRAGFEDVDFGFLDPQAQEVPIPLKASEIMRFMPRLVLEPGGWANYSNWSFSLLGFLIEDVTGQRLDDYLKANIWAPLGMTHTSLIYGHMPANLSQHYVFRKDGTAVADPSIPPHPWISPAGTIVSSARDMARYMNAQILEGEEGGYPLVSKRMFKELHTEGFRNSALSIGFAKAFWTTSLNGAATIEHGGGAPGFQSMMTLIPAKRFGFFVSAMQGGLANGLSYSEAEVKAGKALVQEPTTGFELRESFIDRFLVRTDPIVSGPLSDLRKLPGVYWTQKRPFTTVEALADAFNPAAALTIKLAGDGQGVLLNGWGPYKDIGNGVFASPSDNNVWTDPYTIDRLKPPRIAFLFNPAGAVNGLVAGVGDQVWAPASPLFNPLMMRSGFALFGLIAATGALLFLWPQSRRWRNPSNYLGLLIALAVIAFPYAILGGFAPTDSLTKQLMIGDKTRLWIMIVAANSMLAFEIVLLIRMVSEWLRNTAHSVPGWARAGRLVHLSLVGLSTALVLVVCGFFNFLGVHMPG